jgi:thiamine-phosphate pyrophosphorylase
VSTLPKRPIRYLITRGNLNPSNFSTEKLKTLETVRLAVERGIEMVQIREKSLEGRDLFELTLQAVKLAEAGDARILVNERFDVAVAAGTDGVQLTSTSIPVEYVRSAVPQGFLIGVSTHSEREVLNAKGVGADFAVFGNVFATPGKGEPTGVGGLSSLCAAAGKFPVIAVGGIDESNIDSVIGAGAAGFASIRYLNEFVSIGA